VIGNKTVAAELYVVAVKVFGDATAGTVGLPTVDAHVVDVANEKYTREMNAEVVDNETAFFLNEIISNLRVSRRWRRYSSHEPKN
jgi:hypothetical protein